ncbi:MAG: alpha/beta hydrolase, partial [Eudoraea sp.]|nr:alpha/beta hydrolase [Eudoraea sp.]
MKTTNYFYLGILLISHQLMAQDTILPLWQEENIPNRIPSSEQEIVEKGDIIRISKVQIPSLEVYLPSKANATGEAVLIFPGGGYQILAYDWEGTDIAKFLNSKGIAGIVVKYRLPTSESIIEKHKVPLIDAQRAIR